MPPENRVAGAKLMPPSLCLTHQRAILRDHYFFEGGDRRPCDAWLDALLVDGMGSSARVSEIAAHNRAAEEAWERASHLDAAGCAEEEVGDSPTGQ